MEGDIVGFDGEFGSSENQEIASQTCKNLNSNITPLINWLGVLSDLRLANLLYQKFLKGENVEEIRKKLQDYIKKNGLKKSFVAKELGMSTSKFSCFLHGKLLVTEDIEKKVSEYLKEQ